MEQPDSRHDRPLEVNLDSPGDADEDSETLDIVLDPEPAPVRHDPRTRAVPPEPIAASKLPMIRAGVCERCGYALRPLEETCPRCRALGSAPASFPAPVSTGPAEHSAASPTLPPTPAPRGSRSRAIPVLIIALAIAAGTLTAVWVASSPQYRARALYRAGLRLQLAGDFAGARERYRECLELDPTMALAAFAIGTTYLGLGTPGTSSSMQKLTEEAMWGRTEALDQADRWFRYAIEVAQRLDPGVRLIDERINTPVRLQAYCHASLALTALMRYAAALGADQIDAAMAWLRVAGEEAQRALINDPANDPATQILKTVTPLK